MFKCISKRGSLQLNVNIYTSRSASLNPSASKIYRSKASLFSSIYPDLFVLFRGTNLLLYRHRHHHYCRCRSCRGLKNWEYGEERKINKIISQFSFILSSSSSLPSSSSSSSWSLSCEEREFLDAFVIILLFPLIVIGHEDDKRGFRNTSPHISWTWKHWLVCLLRIEYRRWNT